MTNILSNEKIWILLLLALAIMTLFNGSIWSSPSVNDYYPTNDCGKNWSLGLEWGKNNRCELLIVSDEIVRDVEKRISNEDPQEPGTIRGADALDEALEFIERLLRGF